MSDIPMMHETEGSSYRGLIPALQSSFVKFGEKLDNTADKMVDGLNSVTKTTIEKTVNSALGPISMFMQPFQDVFGIDFGRGLANLVNFKRGTGLFGTGKAFRGPLDERTIKQIDPGSTFLSKTLERLLGEDGKNKFTSIFETLGDFFSGGKLFGMFKDALGIGSLIIGIADMVKGAIEGWRLAEDWGVESWIGAIGGALGGTGEGKENAFRNALTKGALGAGIGMAVFGPVGFIIGGIIGAVGGAILGYFGGEKIAQWIQNAKDSITDYIEDEGWGRILGDFADGALPGGLVGLALFGPVGFIIGAVLGGVSKVLWEFFDQDNALTEGLGNLKTSITSYITDTGWNTVLTEAISGPGPRVGALIGSFGGPLGLVAGFILGLGAQAIINFVSASEWGERIKEVKNNILTAATISLIRYLPHVPDWIREPLRQVAFLGPVGLIAASFVAYGLKSISDFMNSEDTKTTISDTKESVINFMKTTDWGSILMDNLDLGLGISLGLIGGPFGLIAGYLLGWGIKSLVEFIQTPPVQDWIKSTTTSIRKIFSSEKFYSTISSIELPSVVQEILHTPFGMIAGFLVWHGIDAVRGFIDTAGDWVATQRDVVVDRIQTFLSDHDEIVNIARGLVSTGIETLRGIDWAGIGSRIDQRVDDMRDYLSDHGGFFNVTRGVIDSSIGYLRELNWGSIGDRFRDIRFNIGLYLYKNGGFWNVTRGVVNSAIASLQESRLGQAVEGMGDKIRTYITSGEWREAVGERTEGLRATPVGMIVAEFIQGSIDSIRDFISRARDTTIGQWIENAVGGIPEYFAEVGWQSILGNFLKGAKSGAIRGLITGGPVGAVVGALMGGVTNVLMNYLSATGLLPAWLKEGRDAIGSFFRNVNFEELFSNIATGLGIGMAIGAFVLPGPVGFIVGSLVGAGIGAIWTFFKGEGSKEWLGGISLGRIVSGIFGNAKIMSIFSGLLGTIGFPMIGGAIGSLVGSVPGAILGTIIGAVIGWAYRGIMRVLNKTDGDAIVEGVTSDTSFLGMSTRQEVTGALAGFGIGAGGTIIAALAVGATGFVPLAIALLAGAIFGVVGKAIGREVFNAKSYTERLEAMSPIMDF